MEKTEDNNNKNIEEPEFEIQPEATEIQPSNDNTVEIKLINQGAFGCAFRPEITCDNGVGSVDYISKVQMSTENLTNEIAISKEIQKIRHHIFYYASVLNSCPVSLSKIPKTEQDKCDILNQEEARESKIISTKIRYIGSMNIETYLQGLPPREDIIVKKIYATYYHILNGLRKLLTHDIIHYDIKEGNIMYDDNNHSPIIIDFGLSFFPSQVKPDNYSSAFYTKEYYPYWCIEIFLISNIIQVIYKNNRQNENATLGELQQIINAYYGNFYMFLHKYAIDPNDAEKAEFENNINTYIQTLVNKPWTEIVTELFKKEIYSSWDNFSAAMMYSIFFKSLNLNNYATNPTMQQLIALWKSIIFATPNTRKNTTQTIEVLTQIKIVTNPFPILNPNPNNQL